MTKLQICFLETIQQVADLFSGKQKLKILYFEDYISIALFVNMKYM